MKQILLRQGHPAVEEVPAPTVEAGTILVRTQVSCISVGTELAGLKMSGTPLWKKALAQPQKVRQAMDMVGEKGLTRTIAAIKGKVETPHPVGYSAAGTVIAVGRGVEGFAIGDRVACAGAQCAYHAEILRVPVNLATAIPQNVSFEAASTVALGAIALQGIRRAAPTLGETFVVVGLGFLGQLTVQMLRANGCKTIALDPDPKRLAQAVAAGALGLNSQDGDAEGQVARLTGGVGADGVIVTAATASDAVIATAFKMCRKKARVVLVGDVGLNLDRNDIYVKELDFLVSTSYGPGRYDVRYEEEGLDYPINHVRWTENRNMAAYLDLVATSGVKLAGFLDSRFIVDDAPAAYAALTGAQRPMLTLLEYPGGGTELSHTVGFSAFVAAKAGVIRLAVVGAGDFAVAMHLPLIQAMPQFHLAAVFNRTGHKAVAAAKRFGADAALTDFDTVLADTTIDAVLIATRDQAHWPQALAALKANKHVLVEKPLVTNREQLREAEAVLSQSGPVLEVGFNRRHADQITWFSQLAQARSGPLMVSYEMNASYLPNSHWFFGPDGSGRNVGEACHIYDLFTAMTGARLRSLNAIPVSIGRSKYRVSDNFAVLAKFEDGSVATLQYTAMGPKAVSKERMRVFWDGNSFLLDDYKTCQMNWESGRSESRDYSDKGWKNELANFASAIRSDGGRATAWQYLQAMAMALEVEDILRRGGDEN